MQLTRDLFAIAKFLLVTLVGGGYLQHFFIMKTFSEELRRCTMKTLRRNWIQSSTDNDYLCGEATDVLRTPRCEYVSLSGVDSRL